MHSIGEREMAAFDRSILSRIVGACGDDQASLLGEQVLHLWMVEQLAALIEMDTLVQARWIALAEKAQQPLWRGTF